MVASLSYLIEKVLDTNNPRDVHLIIDVMREQSCEIRVVFNYPRGVELFLNYSDI